MAVDDRVVETLESVLAVVVAVLDRETDLEFTPLCRLATDLRTAVEAGRDRVEAGGVALIFRDGGLGDPGDREDMFARDFRVITTFSGTDSAGVSEAAILALSWSSSRATLVSNSETLL